MIPARAAVFAAFWIIALVTGFVTTSFEPARAQTTERVDGILTVVWGDPRPGSGGGATLFTLTTPDGAKRQLQVAPADQNAAINYFGKRVIVTGRSLGAATASRPAAMAVDRIELAEPEAAEPQAAKALTTKRVLFILLKFKGDSQTPHPPGFFAQLTNPLVPPAGSPTPATINGFYNKTSWGQFRWVAQVAGVGGLNPTQWFVLPGTKAQYANCGWSGVCADLDAISRDGIARAVAAGINVAAYDNLNFVLNNDLDCCAWGGSTVHNGKVYGATWEPPWGQEAHTYVHEHGHSIGLPHSGWRYYAYDSPWDEMSTGSSAQNVACGNYNSANSGGNRPLTCTKPGGGFITAHKDRLGWIPAANRVTINTISTRTVTLAANATVLGNSIKMIKICLKGFPCSGAAARFLTVETRLKVADFEMGLPTQGVLIHEFRANRPPIGGGNACFFNTQSGWAVPIDSTPGDWRGPPNCDSGGRAFPNYALFNARYGVGKTYSNAGLGVSVQVVSKQGNAFVVRVTRSK